MATRTVARMVAMVVRLMCTSVVTLMVAVRVSISSLVLLYDRACCVKETTLNYAKAPFLTPDSARERRTQRPSQECKYYDIPP